MSALKLGQPLYKLFEVSRYLRIASFPCDCHLSLPSDFVDIVKSGPHTQTTGFYSNVINKPRLFQVPKKRHITMNVIWSEGCAFANIGGGHSRDTIHNGQ